MNRLSLSLVTSLFLVGCKPKCDPNNPKHDKDGDGYFNDKCTTGYNEYTHTTDYIGHDCDDDDSSIYPGAVEVNCNGHDDNCDGYESEHSIIYVDADGDSFGDINAEPMSFGECSRPDGYSFNNLDCDDTNPSINPANSNTADDCSGSTDLDSDGYTVEEGDCDDYDAEMHPNSNDVFNDCEGNDDYSFEPNDDFSTSTLIQCGSNVTASIGSDTDEDYYTFDLGDGLNRVDMIFVDSNQITQSSLYDSSYDLKGMNGSWLSGTAFVKVSGNESHTDPTYLFELSCRECNYGIPSQTVCRLVDGNIDVWEQDECAQPIQMVDDCTEDETCKDHPDGAQCISDGSSTDEDCGDTHYYCQFSNEYTSDYLYHSVILYENDCTDGLYLLEVCDDDEDCHAGGDSSVRPTCY